MKHTKATKHAIKLLLPILAIGLVACNQMKINRPNGWYLITDTIEYLKLERTKGEKVASENHEADSLREQKHKKAWEEAHKYRATITDSVFLKTTVPMSDQAIDYLTLTGWNMDYAYNQVVYLAALERAKKHLAVKNNQLILNLKSGAEINVSDDLFQYIAEFVISNWNELIRKGIVEIEKTDKGYYDIVPPKRLNKNSDKPESPTNHS